MLNCKFAQKLKIRNKKENQITAIKQKIQRNKIHNTVTVEQNSRTEQSSLYNIIIIRDDNLQDLFHSIVVIKIKIQKCEKTQNKKK